MISDTSIGADTYAHIAIVRNGSDFYMFVDGVEEDTMVTSNAINSTTTDVLIGNSWINNGSTLNTTWFDGFIDKSNRLSKNVKLR